MEFTEQHVFEAFDLTPEKPETPPAGQETAPTGETAGNNTPSGSTQSGSGTAEETPGTDAGTDGGGQQQAGEGGAEDSGADPANSGDKPTQTQEQRRENAARRRQAEQQAAIEQALAEERKKHEQEFKDFFAAASLKNTVTGKPITNMEEFNAWKQDFAAAKLQRELKAGKLTPESLNEAISANPAVQQMQRMAAEQEEAKRQAGQQAAKARIDAEIAEIGKLDPTIHEAGDLLKMPKAKEFYEYVRKGYTFLDAYRLSNFDQLTARTAEAARQQALTNARGKDHLTPSQQRGAGAASVPADEMEVFRAFNPGTTDAEIQDYYNKSRKKT